MCRVYGNAAVMIIPFENISTIQCVPYMCVLRKEGRQQFYSQRFDVVHLKWSRSKRSDLRHVKPVCVYYYGFLNAIYFAIIQLNCKVIRLL